MGFWTVDFDFGLGFWSLDSGLTVCSSATVLLLLGTYAMPGGRRKKLPTSPVRGKGTMDSWILRKRFADETDSEAEPEASGIAGEDLPSSSVSAVSVFSSPAASQGLVAGLRRSLSCSSASSSIPLSLGESEDQDIEDFKRKNGFKRGTIAILLIVVSLFTIVWPGSLNRFLLDTF